MVLMGIIKEHALGHAKEAVCKDDPAKALNALKHQHGHDILVLGSAALVHSLMAADLIVNIGSWSDPSSWGAESASSKTGW